MKDPVHDVHVGLEELAAEDCAGWQPQALSDRLRDVTGLAEALQVEVIRTWPGGITCVPGPTMVPSPPCPG